MKIFIVLAVVCLGGACAMEFGKVGGLGDEVVLPKELSATAEKRPIYGVVEKVIPEVEKMTRKQIQSLVPLRYKEQVVAGVNYFVKALMTEKSGTKSHIHLRIYRHFTGTVELTAVKTDVDEKTKLEHFE